MSMRATLRRSGWIAAAAVAAVALAGCATGERPTFAQEPELTDPAVIAVADLLAGSDGATFTAEYVVSPAIQTVDPVPATVSQAPGRRLIDIGTVRVTIDGGAISTCDETSGTCSDTADDALLSGWQITHRFYGESALGRLRADGARAIGPATASTEEIAGQPATCVAVPVSGGTPLYCALDSGVLARMIGGDVTIELTTYRGEFDELLFRGVTESD